MLIVVKYKSASFSHTMAAPALPTIEQAQHKKFKTEYLYENHTSNITTKKKQNHCLLNMIYCFNIFYQFLKRVCTTILCPGATNTERNVRLHLVLTNSSPTLPMLERSLRLYVVRVHVGYRVDKQYNYKCHLLNMIHWF